jgi:hypothetical protein
MLNSEAQTQVDALLRKNISELNEDEVDFLRARRDYIREDDRQAYADVFTASEKRQKEKSKTVEKKVEVKDGNAFPPAVEAEEASYRDLQEEAKALGMEKVTAVSRKDLESFIAQHKK